MKPYQFNASEIRDEGPSLPDEFIRKVLNFPKVGVRAQAQARYGSAALESDRREHRRAEIREQLGELEREWWRMTQLMCALRLEDQLLEAPK